MNKREMMKAAKPLQSRSHENDKNIWDAAKHLRDGALGTVSLYILIIIMAQTTVLLVKLHVLIG